MDGVLVVDKPAGMTSHDVVDEVRRRLKTKKVGHAGTLDPDATGILLLGLGKATRFLSYAQASPKRYRATARFGITTSTHDASGEVLEERGVELTLGEVEAAVAPLTGEIDQLPPMVSAVKIGGERLYKKARRGEDIERPTRKVTVFRFELVDFDDSNSAPTASFDILCSAGTYVRTLLHDLGQRLGCGAHMTSLRRTEAGGFTEADATALAEVNDRVVRPVVEVVRELRQVELDAESERLVADGRPVPNDGITDRHVALVAQGRLLGVYKPAGDLLVPERVVAQAGPPR